MIEIGKVTYLMVDVRTKQACVEGEEMPRG